MKNNKNFNQQYEEELEYLENQIFGDKLPSKKFYCNYKKKNDEIRRDSKFEKIYSWLEGSEEKLLMNIGI